MKKIIIITLSASFFIVACGNKKVAKDKTVQLQELKEEQKNLKDKIATIEKEIGKKDTIVATPVQINSMTPTIFINYIDVQGKIDADNNQVASPEAPGVINQIFIHIGQMVHKGQVLATLKTTQLNTINDGIAELDQQINFAKTLYDKQQRLWKQEIGTEVQLLSAKNNYEALLKKKNTLQNQWNNNKSMYNIYAPTDGVIDAIDIKVGSAISPGMPMGIRIVNTSKIKVKANIAENYGARVSSGDQVMLIFPDINDTLITKIGYVTKVIDPISRTFIAEIPIAQNGYFKPNMIVKARIVGYRNDRAFVLPEGVIQKIGTENYVYVVQADGTAKLAPIQLGESYMGKVEIKSGLHLGEQVIVNGYADLNEGDHVVVN